ncbi:uncharacterized protein BDV14DRAFT_179875 [Aspergillus stella-maris]|uniref:uncharacterized protein n=1 Tax=Aspergillus stella-maris TaxID=1810926 RepID=UPI003CCE0078
MSCSFLFSFSKILPTQDGPIPGTNDFFFYNPLLIIFSKSKSPRSLSNAPNCKASKTLASINTPTHQQTKMPPRPRLRQATRIGAFSNLGFQEALMVTFVTFLGLSVTLCFVKCLVQTALDVQGLFFAVRDTEVGKRTLANIVVSFMVGFMLFLHFSFFSPFSE